MLLNKIYRTPKCREQSESLMEVVSQSIGSISRLIQSAHDLTTERPLNCCWQSHYLTFFSSAFGACSLMNVKRMTTPMVTTWSQKNMPLQSQQQHINNTPLLLLQQHIGKMPSPITATKYLQHAPAITAT